MFITGRRAGVPVAIVLIVIMLLILSIYAIFLFNSRAGKTTLDFGNYIYINDLYRDVEALNFNLEKALDFALESGNFESEFNSRVELLKKEYNFEILSKSVDFSSNSYEAELEVFITAKEEGFEAEYTYEKTFINK